MVEEQYKTRPGDLVVQELLLFSDETILNHISGPTSSFVLQKVDKKLNEFMPGVAKGGGVIDYAFTISREIQNRKPKKKLVIKFDKKQALNYKGF